MAGQTALTRPPVALSLYIVASIVKAPMKDANRAIWPFMVEVIGITIAMALFPAVPLWIPKRFGFYGRALGSPSIKEQHDGQSRYRHPGPARHCPARRA